MNPQISFGDTNSGFQIGINNGSINVAGDINIYTIATIRPIAHSVYKSLFNTSDLFTQVRDELGLLVSVLIATEEHTPKSRPNDPQLSELDDVLAGCYGVLQDLVRLKEHFDNVGAQTQITWERMGWGVEELKEIRGKFSLHIQMLNFLNTKILRSSHENVERLLETFMSEIRSGKRESAAMSCVSTGSLTVDEKEAWRILRKELQNIGITPEVFTQHRQYILSTLRDFLTQGEIADSPKTFEVKGTETKSEATPITTDSSPEVAYQQLSESPAVDLYPHASEEMALTGRQHVIPATASGVEPKKRLKIMTRLASRMMRLTTGKSTDKEVSKTHTSPPLQYQFHGVCMVCLEDIEVPDPSAPAAAGGTSLHEDLPSNLIHWEYMDTPCGHTFHIACWKRRLEYRSRCPVCYQRLTLDKEFLDSLPVDVELDTKEQTHQTSTGTTYQTDPRTGRPVVLFVAASLFEFDLDRIHSESGYPYLKYTVGDLFSVIAQREELWLAFNQEDPARSFGWIWEKHFRRLDGEPS